MGGVSPTIVTTSGSQTITGAKTFQHQKLLFRNRADDASLTLQNPVFSGAKDMFLDTPADFIVFIDANDSNKVKALAGDTHAKEFEHATDLGNVLSSIHGSLSSTNGGTIEVKAGGYGWNTKLSVTKAHVGLFANRGANVTTTSGFVQDHISVEKDNFQIQNFRFDCTNQGNGNGSWLVVGSTTNSDFLKVYNNYIKSPGTHGIDLQTNCGGGIIAYNQIQSLLAPTGDGIRCGSNADHEIIANGIGGFANATNGYGIRLSSAINVIIALNRSFVNRIGIRAYLATGCIISNNFTQSNAQYGIQIVNDTTTQKGRTIITGNRCHDNGTASANNYDGINVAISSTGGLDNLVISENMCTDQNATVGSKDQRYGISLTGSPNLLTNSVISNNVVAGNRTGGILRGAITLGSLKIFNNAGEIEPSLTIPAFESDYPSITGTLSPGNSSTITTGLWVGATATGTQSSQVLTGGLSRRQAAAGAIGDNAGWRQTLGTSRRAWGSEYYCRFALSHTSTDLRTFFGLCSSSAAPTGDDWLNALSGIGLSVISTNANFRLGKNDGTGATVFIDTGVATDTAVHYFRIIADDANSRWGWSFDSTSPTWETADIPASTTSLSPIYEIEAVTATAVTMDNFKNVIRNRHY